MVYPIRHPGEYDLVAAEGWKPSLLNPLEGLYRLPMGSELPSGMEYVKEFSGKPVVDEHGLLLQKFQGIKKI
jgi:hypothetical protein